MLGKKLSGTRGAVLFALILLLTLVPVPGVWARVGYKTLYKFKGRTDGKGPADSVTFDPAGNLYGTTEDGGAYNRGTVFRLAPTGDGSWTESVLYSFGSDRKDGEFPSASLIFDTEGNLYGTTAFGGKYGDGTVFSLSTNGDGGWTESVLHSFSKDGQNPDSALIFDTAGNLYGTASYGGAYFGGTVFRLTPDGEGSWTESVLHSFNSTDGTYPWAGLIFDKRGNLYGTTRLGGSHSYGTVFELTANGDGSWTESVLHSFNATAGDQPYAGVIFDGAGNLYGTTYSGGVHNDGVVFRLAPRADGSWAETVLHSFDGTDGNNPLASLIFDQAGNLYGTTVGGGAYGNLGTVFKLKATTKGVWKETVLHSFRNRPGSNPWSGLVFDRHGNLYLTTAGKRGGTVFEITP